MPSGDYVINIDSSYTDDIGNCLIGDNDVLSVFYYDATASGTDEAWVKNWDTPNTILNSYFSSTVTGSNWVYSSDDVTTPYTFNISRFAGWNNTDLLRGMTVTSSGYSGGYAPSNLVAYKTSDGWATGSAAGDGAYAATVDMGELKNVNYTWLVPGQGDDNGRFLKEYRIGVSSTGNENDFTIVASGITVSGSLEPKINFIGNLNTRYVKLYVDSNWGAADYTFVNKFSAFYEPDWSMFGFRNKTTSTQGTYAEWYQDVNFTNIDKVYMDIRALMSNSYQVGELYVLVDSDVLQTYDWASTGASWIDSNDDNFWTRDEEAFDVSGYSGSHALKLRMWGGTTYHREAFMGFFDNIRTQPGWYVENPSSTRGNRAAFPDEVFIVADRAGLSIIDKYYMRLWMRFNIGPGYILESAVRDIYADEGKIYLATSRGLVVIDFIENRAWKYNADGLYYRMALKKRNEYGFWFLEDAALGIKSTDVYSVSGGWNPATGYYVVAGTAAGMSYIEHGSLVANSAFNYPVRKVKSSDDRLFYIGGDYSESRIGVIEDISLLQSDNFTNSSLLFSDYCKLENDSFDGSVSNQWFCSDGDLPISFKAGVFTVSGTKSDIGNTVVIQKELTPNRPFTASVEVKIRDWEERPQGGFHFGLTSGWPYETLDYYDGNNAVMMSAANGIKGVYFEDETFAKGISARWLKTVDLGNYCKIERSDNSVRFYGTLLSSSGSYKGAVLGSNKAFPSCPSFAAKVKAKITSIPNPSSGRRASVLFGVTDGQYLGEGSGTNGLAMSCCVHSSSPNPAVYCMASKTLNYTWSWSTTNSQPLFSGDGTEAADYHTWEFSYNSATDTLMCAVDGLSLGSVNTSLGSSVGIIFGIAGDDLSTEYINVFFKDFEIDFGAPAIGAQKKYILEKVESGAWTRPTSGSDLVGVSFDALDATSSADWREWIITYDGTTLSGSIDGHAVGTPISTTLGSSPKIFMAYDMPATNSGTSAAELQIKNFDVSYDDNTVIKGYPTDIYTVSGTYLGTDYMGIYVATSSGINHLMYPQTSSISGTPSVFSLYGIAGSGADHELLAGTLNHFSSVEPEEGIVGPNGLLYAGSSRYKECGWQKLKNRAGAESVDLSTTLGVTYSGTLLFLSADPTGSDNSVLYKKNVGTDGDRWVVAGAGTQAGGLGSVEYRDYPMDVRGDDTVYWLGRSWLGIYNYVNDRWEGTNFGTGPINTSSVNFPGDETAIIFPKKEFVLAYNGDVARFFTELGSWEGGKLFFNTFPGSGRLAIAYSEVDDSIYMLTNGSSSNFFRLSLRTRIWSSALSDCPLPFDFDHGVYFFYRPYDECLYLLMAGASDSYGRKLLKYDVKSGEWDFYGEDFPEAAYDFMHGAYSISSDTLFVVAGDASAAMYKYTFPRDVAPRFVSWSSSEGVAPESSSVGRFIKVSPNAGSWVGDDSFDNSDTEVYWFDYLTHATDKTNMSEGDNLDVLVNYNTEPGYKMALRTQSVPMPSGDFEATLDVKIKDMPTPNAVGTINSLVFGVSDHLGFPSYSSDTEVGQTFTGQNGLWMLAYNDNSTSNRYSLWKREGSSDTRYGSSAYQLFSSGDATGAASYKSWKVSYSQANKRLSAYLDDVLIGQASFSGRGLENGLALNIGAYCYQTNVSGTVDVDISNLEITCDSTAEMFSNYLKINDDNEYCYVYYEKYDSTLSSGVGYAYETDWGLDTYAVTDTSYITTLGAVEDGHRQALLGALYSGSRKIGVYSNGDPRSASSYLGTIEHDWSSRTTYKMVSDNNRIRVYLDGASSPSIDVDYNSLPYTANRRVRFGSLNPDLYRTRSVIDANTANNITISGSWTTEHATSTTKDSFFGGHKYAAAGTSATSITFRFNDSGNADVFVFYPAKNSATDAPFTIHHNGVVTLPTADSYASNPINTVYDNVDEGGNALATATTVDVAQNRMSSGRAYDSLDNKNTSPSGYVYLGTYTDVSRVVVTADAAGTVYADTIVLKHCTTMPRARSLSKVYKVAYTVGETEASTEDDFVGAFTVVDMLSGIQIDSYNTDSAPSILDDNITDFNVVS